MGRRSRSSSHSRSRSRSHSRSRSQSARSEVEGTRVHVGDISVNVSKQDLEKAFEKYGRLEEVWMARTPPCFAFIVFQNREDAEEAVRCLNGQIIGGSRVRVSVALPRVRERRRRATFDSNMKCYQCGERGHFARDCYTVGRNRNRWSPRRRSRSPRRSRRDASSSSRSRSRSRDRRSKRHRSEDDSREKGRARDKHSEKKSSEKRSSEKKERRNKDRSVERRERRTSDAETKTELAVESS